ncbi:MAG: hypothetical protein H6Q20_2168 [Bacteroidetes bacterium]|nr:hypothetical protein [Bacteroidota bacterium]
MGTDLLPGGWTPYVAPIPDDVQKLFDSVIKNLTGVKYTPLAVATQVVAGVNYRFFCNAKGVYPNALNEAAIVQIYKPLDGSAHITSIQKVP